MYTRSWFIKDEDQSYKNAEPSLIVGLTDTRSEDDSPVYSILCIEYCGIMSFITFLTGISGWSRFSPDIFKLSKYMDNSFDVST